ncbi:MAG TPA: peptide-methionine (S)-S-oxide reductase MsrA [Bryobacteraceae bacterium]|jgi:peptide-methionine (S)-S-oxide reductase|nr:peptide-methionine (S)-S-oxide reductase MsrA [Bryobacteraceae bacterium]
MPKPAIQFTRFIFRTGLAGLIACSILGAAHLPDPTVDQNRSEKKSETTVFAGGCFWGVEAVFDAVKGVTEAVSGYAGGSKANAHYELVSTGTTGHAESVQITYDPSQISFGQLLKVYFSVAHDPTELNRQGPDQGTQYRSEIFYTSEEQQRIAEAYIQQLNAATVFRKPIVTKVAPLQAFYRAEEYHQHFVARNPRQPYVAQNDLPKLGKLLKELPELVKGGKP